ncbi:MAG: hypothetical protein RR672_13815, partial [Raoultibacter sp.]
RISFRLIILVLTLVSLLCLTACNTQPNSTPQADEGQAATTSSYGKPLEGLEDPTSTPLASDISGCSECHGQAGYRVMPKDHDGRADDTCLSCHSESGEGGGTAIPHTLGATQ